MDISVGTMLELEVTCQYCGCATNAEIRWNGESFETVKTINLHKKPKTLLDILGKYLDSEEKK